MIFFSFMVSRTLAALSWSIHSGKDQCSVGILPYLVVPDTSAVVTFLNSSLKSSSLRKTQS